VQNSPRHLHVHNGEANNGSPAAAYQLDFRHANHRHHAHRQRDLMAAVEDDPRCKTRHERLVWWLSAYAGDDGVAQISLARLARERKRDPSNVRADVRDLVA